MTEPLGHFAPRRQVVMDGLTTGAIFNGTTCTTCTTAGLCGGNAAGVFV